MMVKAYDHDPRLGFTVKELVDTYACTWTSKGAAADMCKRYEGEFGSKPEIIIVEIHTYYEIL